MVSALLLKPDQVREVRDAAAGDDVLELANFLCPGNTVLSGAKAAVARAAEEIEKAGGRPIPLAVAGAFHTALMKPADERLARGPRRRRDQGSPRAGRVERRRRPAHRPRRDP